MEFQKKQEVETFLHSVLSCEKGGIPLSKLQEEYTVLIGSPIPFQTFGFDTLIDYIKSIPNTATIRKSPNNGAIIVQAVYKPVTAHVSQLVAGQKVAAKTKPARRPSRHPAPRTGPSVRFASYQSRLDSQKLSSTIAATLSPMPVPPRRTHRGIGRGLPQLRQPSTKPGFRYEVPPRWQRPSNGLSSVMVSNSPSGNAIGEPVSRAPLRMPRTASDGSTLQPAATPMPAPPPKLPTPPVTRPAPKTCRELVEEYGRSRGLAVSFSAMSTLSSKKGPLVWLATLKVDVQSYYSYPDEKESREEAEEEAARKALSYLGLNDSQLQENSQLRETSVSTPKQVEDFVGRIKELLLQKSNGLFSTVVPQMYQEQYQESVPKNWLELVKDSGVMCTHDAAKDCFILYPQTSSRTTSQTGHRQSVTDTGPVHGPVPGKLPLPEGNHWDVFVTYAASTADVFFRLLDFTDQYEQLTEEMDKFYAEHSLPVSEAKEKWLYATNVEDNWMRVQVLEVQNGKADCFFLDHGDVDSVPIHKLQELDPKFLNLPFQIVHCQLDDLGDFADDEQANKLLNELFVGKCLIAEVAAREPVVTATFYDTTTDEDVNLNALLLKRRETPTLPGPEQITRVRLGHIDSEGNLYVQLQESGLSHVTRFMGFVGSHIMQNNHQPASSLCESKLYACRMKDSVTFCRALLLSAVRTKDGKVLVRLVDIGQETLVDASNLYELEAFGESFVSFPHQAIICRLADIAPGLWTSKATSLLREMVPSDIDLLLKVVRPAKDGSQPLVALFKRIGPNNELVSVNTSLAVALESSKQEERKAKRVPALTRVSSQTFSEKKVEEKKFDEKKAESKKAEQKKAEAATNGGSGDFSPTSKVSASTLTIGPTGDGPSISGMTSPLSELTALSLMSSPELDEEGLQGKPLAAPELPEVGNYLDVNVTEAANPLNFTCQSYAQGAKLDALMAEMQSFYAAEGSSAFPEGLPEALLRKGRYYAGRHMDKCWYRVLVQQVQGPLMASVYFVDYGDYGMMQPSELQPLWQRFRHLPVQAIQASLAGVEPVQNDWNPVDCINFRNIVKDRLFVARIVAKRPDTKTGVEGAQHLVVRLVDTSTSDDVYIAQLLAERGIVRLVPT